LLLLFDLGGSMEESCSAPETILAATHLNSMGRDEMNLAEFPLATLADRAPRGCKTLVYEDRIWDRGQGQYRVRRLTISASDKYGLPTALDDEVILGLVQISKAAGFVERRVRFSRYQLIHLLGWRDEGRSYRRLRQSLKRWLGVTLYYENAWWDKERKRWVDAVFIFWTTWSSIAGQSRVRSFLPRTTTGRCHPSPGMKWFSAVFKPAFSRSLTSICTAG